MWDRSGTGVICEDALYRIAIFAVGTAWNRSGTVVKWEEALGKLSMSTFWNLSEPCGTVAEPA